MFKQKIIPIVSVVIISILASLFFINSPSSDQDVLSETFFVDATYYESKGGFVEIRFEDKSKNTKTIVLEILGMEDSFQKTFDDVNEFTEIVPFFQVPKYGWQIHPITLAIEHKGLGNVNLKTEIHPIDEPAPHVIFSRS